MNPSEQLPDKPDKATILAVLQLLRKYNLKTTEEVLKKETNVDLTVPGSHEPNQNESEEGALTKGEKNFSAVGNPALIVNSRISTTLATVTAFRENGIR